MCTDVSKIVDVLGKPVTDPYGRRLGYAVSIFSNADGKVVSLEVNYNDLEHREIPIERFNITPDAVVLIPEHEFKALLVENRLKIIKGRLASLEDLYAKKEIPTHAYEAFKKKLESEIVNIKNMSKEVKDALRRRIHEVEDQIAEVEKAIASLKTSYLAGEIPEKPYLTAVNIMKRSLEILLKEKDALKKHLDLIESLEAMPITSAVGLTVQERTGQSETQPVQVVVVE